MDFNAEAYFTIEAPSARVARAALAAAETAIAQALARVNYPAGVSVTLSLEDESGNVEES